MRLPFHGARHIDTAPVWEAYRANGECPLCALERASERDYVTSFLGGSVMESAVRIVVNATGFCAAHFRMLYNAGDRLPLALMAHTHLKETIARIERDAPPADGCVVCDRLNDAMARYEDTLLTMWARETEFRDAFAQSKGLCTRHYAHLHARAPQALSGRDAAQFREALKRVTLDNLGRVERDIEWFTLKFDYRNRDKPWGESRDAVERTLNKLRSNTIDKREEDVP